MTSAAWRSRAARGLHQPQQSSQRHFSSSWLGHPGCPCPPSVPTQPSMRTRCTSRRIPQRPAAAATAHPSDALARPMPSPIQPPAGRRPGWPTAQRSCSAQSPAAQPPGRPARRSSMGSPTRRTDGRLTTARSSSRRRRQQPRRAQRSASAPQPAQPSIGRRPIRGRTGNLPSARRAGHLRGKRQRARMPSRQGRQPLTPRQALRQGTQKRAQSSQVHDSNAGNTSRHWLCFHAASSSFRLR